MNINIFQPKGEPPIDFYLRSKEIKEDIVYDKKILNIIREKIEKVSNIDECEIKGENLIYYCAFDFSYAKLLAMSIYSLFKTNSQNFKILILTDLKTKDYICNLLGQHILNKKIHFKLLNTPSCGIEASKCKTRIYEYENINYYENILYLDCDIISIKNIDFIFDNLQNETLYVSNNNGLLKIDAHKFNPYIGFRLIKDEIFQKIKLKNQRPFNAGQFLFKNSSRMKKHFENINWFMKNWKSKYFFEQSFMNYYFCSALLTKNYLDELVFFAKKDCKDLPLRKSIFIHFVGPALEGEEKLINIKNYYKKHKIF